MFSYVSLEERVPTDHPLRAIRRITDRALEQLSPRFGALYVHFGRPSVPPEQLLRALLLQALYTIRSERQLMEQTGLQPAVSLVRRPGHGRRGVVAHDLQQESGSPARRGHRRGVLRGGVEQANRERLLSDEHFTVDGTLLEAWASHKSFQPRDEEPPSEAAGIPR